MKQREKKTNNNNKNDQIQKYDVRHVETSENTHRMRARAREWTETGRKSSDKNLLYYERCVMLLCTCCDCNDKIDREDEKKMKEIPSLETQSEIE